MHKSITSKALSLLLTLLMSLGIFATVQVAVPTAYAETVGQYEVNFATSGNTATENGVTADATITASGSRFAFVTTDFSGTSTQSGLFKFSIDGEKENGDGFSFEDNFYVKQGQPVDGMKVRHTINFNLFGNVSNLELSLDFTADDVYGLSRPAPQTINGQTINMYFDWLGFCVGAGEDVYPVIDMENNPTVAGTYTISLSSVKANYSKTFTVTAESDYNDTLNDGFVMPAQDVDDFLFTVTFTPRSGSSTSSSSSKSSSSNNNRNNNSYTPPSTPTPAPANTASAVKSVKDAVTAAKNSPNGAAVTIKNVTTISLDTMREMAKAAGNTALKVSADSLATSGAVDVRITFDPASAKSGVNLSASTSSVEAKNTEKKFQQYFNNSISVVSLSQKGSFGMPVAVAARVNEKLNPATLVFYSFDSKTNTFTQIENPNYKVDKNGYVHFTTSIGGEIVISDKPLMKK